MRAIRGNTQVMSGTLPFSAVNETFHNELFQKKAIADFVQSVTPVAGVQDEGSVVVTALIPVEQTTANVSGTNLNLTVADLGYIAGAVGEKAAKTRVILRNADTRGPIVDEDEREIYGYLVVDGDDTKIKFYVWDGVNEVAATLPANVNIEFQAMRRFTLDSVGEDFGANEKWAMGIVDTTTALNLEQLARDLYGADWALNGNGLQIATDGVKGLFDLFADHLADTEDAHDASAISAEVTGIAGANVQEILEGLKNYIDNGSTETSGSFIDALNAHINAETAHSGTQIAIAEYSGTTGGTLAASNLQVALQELVDRARSNYMLIDTHMTEDTAHRARNIDVELSGTALEAHFGTSGTIDLQEFLTDLDNHLHGEIAAQSGTFRTEMDQVVADLAAASGTLQGAIDDLADSISGTVQPMIDNLDARMEALLGIEDGADEMTFVGPYVSGTTDVTAAINAIAQALQGATDDGDANVGRIEGILGIATGANQLGADGQFIDAANTVKTNFEALDTEIVHVMNKLGVDLAETHAVTFTSLSGTQVVADTDTFAVAIDKVRANLEAHQASTEAHDAASITFASGTAPASMIPADNVQDALMNVGRRLYTLEKEAVESEDLTCVANQTVYALSNPIKVVDGVFSKPLVIINGIVQKFGVDFTVNNNGAEGVGQIVLIDVMFETGDTMEVWYKKVVVLA